LALSDFAGIASKLVWVVFGLAMCLCAASGALVARILAHLAGREANPAPRGPPGPGVPVTVSG